MAVPADDNAWKNVVQWIEEEKCILILGPEITLLDSEKSINELIKDQLDSTGNDVKYYIDDEFFHFTDDAEEVGALPTIQSFYSDLKPNDIHQKISEIPFHFIINVSPDLILREVFDSKKLSYNFDYYNKQQNPDPVKESPTSKRPLIYNIFGNIDQDESVVLTYSELFDYIISISKKDDLPQIVKSQIQSAKLFLFLGFKFEKWYFKLLLRLLKIQDGKNIRQAGKGKDMQQQIRNFYSDEFKIKFLEYSSTEIVNSIHSRFLAKNSLRGVANQDNSNKPQVFLSYGWGGESEKTADTIYSSLTTKGFNIIRDKIDLGYLGNIKQFMQTIGKGKYVVMIVSDKYLKSENCMFEILEVKNNGSIYNRIFPVVLSDAKIYNEVDRIDYINFWDQKVLELKEKIKTIQDPVGTGKVIEKINQFADIRRAFDDITDMLRNMNTLSPEIHNNTNFESLTAALSKRMESENSN